MLNIEDLYLFDLVVKHGSFSSASSYTFLTPQALTHRIDKLEKQLGVQLFIRSFHGVKLTAAGKKLHFSAESLIKESQILVKDLQRFQKKDNIIRIGTSILNPVTRITPLLNEVLKKLPGYKIQYVPLETLDIIFPNVYSHLGEDIDLIFGIFETFNNTNFIKLKDLSYVVFMNWQDPLAKKETITLEDLQNKTLTFPAKHTSVASEEIYQEIKERNININYQITDNHYLVLTLNRFIETGQYLLIPSSDNLLPGLVSKTIDLKAKIPYGIITPKHPTKALAKFITKLKDEINNN